MTFLSVYTPTYRRPFLLALCKTSVAAQTLACEHVIVEDKVGIGIAGVYAAVPDHAHKVTGEYVMVLSDDNILADADFAADLATIAWDNDLPDVIVFKGQIETTTQPAAWCCEPIETMIDLSCFAVRREVWQDNARAWGHRYEGDFDFIHHLWAEEGYRFHWWDRLGFQALRISRGAPE